MNMQVEDFERGARMVWLWGLNCYPNGIAPYDCGELEERIGCPPGTIEEMAAEGMVQVREHESRVILTNLPWMEMKDFDLATVMNIWDVCCERRRRWTAERYAERSA